MTAKILSLVKKLHDQRCYASNGGYAINCSVETREGQSFSSLNKEGNVILTLDGYKILPIEVYNARIISHYTFKERIKILFFGGL